MFLWYAVIEIEILLQFHIVTHVDWHIARLCCVHVM